MDSVPAALLYPLARVGAAAVTTAGSPEVREKLRLAQAGKLGNAETDVLGAELGALAVLLSR